MGTEALTGTAASPVPRCAVRRGVISGRAWLTDSAWGEWRGLAAKPGV